MFAFFEFYVECVLCLCVCVCVRDVSGLLVALEIPCLCARVLVCLFACVRGLSNRIMLWSELPSLRRKHATPTRSRSHQVPTPRDNR